MRKLILDFYPNEMLRNAQKPIFEDIQSYELLEMLKIDIGEGIQVALSLITTKDNTSIQDVKLPGFIEIMSVLKSEGNKHTCVVKGYQQDRFEQMNKEFNLDLIWTAPVILSEEKLTYSCIGDQDNLIKFIDIMKKHGQIKNMRFQKAAYQEHDILSVLTEKQREILFAAHKNGYYDYPKKINGQVLAQKVNLSKATLLQHLRKAEGRLIEHIFTGYQSG